MGVWSYWGLLQHMGMTCRRGKWMQGDADSSMFEIVPTADWLQLLTKHAAREEDSIRYATYHYLVKDPSTTSKHCTCVRTGNCWLVICICTHPELTVV